MQQGDNSMKTTIFALCFLCATAAFGQGYLNGESHPTEFPSHVEHASQQGMAQSQNVMEQSSSFHGQGQRPLWEVQPAARTIPLGDIARAVRKEHAAAKKSTIVWEN
jgi:hypothetical protein